LLIEEGKRKESELKAYEKKLINYITKDILAESQKIGSVRFAFKSFKNVSNDYLRELTDVIREKANEPIVVLLASITENTSNLVLASSSDIELQKIFSILVEKYSLRGGGKGNLIQIGGVNPERIGEIISFLKQNLIF
jgi:alanyl-tRNA synthetase